MCSARKRSVLSGQPVKVYVKPSYTSGGDCDSEFSGRSDESHTMRAFTCACKFEMMGLEKRKKK
jgi:hypothetical protein